MQIISKFFAGFLFNCFLATNVNCEVDVNSFVDEKKGEVSQAIIELLSISGIGSEVKKIPEVVDLVQGKTDPAIFWKSGHPRHKIQSPLIKNDEQAKKIVELGLQKLGFKDEVCLSTIPTDRPVIILIHSSCLDSFSKRLNFCRNMLQTTLRNRKNVRVICLSGTRNLASELSETLRKMATLEGNLGGNIEGNLGNNGNGNLVEFKQEWKFESNRTQDQEKESISFTINNSGNTAVNYEVIFASSSSGRRSTTDDTLKELVKKHPKLMVDNPIFISISEQPFVTRQALTTRRFLEEAYGRDVEIFGCGLGICEELLKPGDLRRTAAIFLDEISKILYEINLKTYQNL